MKRRRRKMTIGMLGLMALALAGSGCIIVDDGDDPPPYYDPDPDPTPTPDPPYQPSWVEVSCFATGAQASSSSLPGSIDFEPVQATGTPDTQNWNNPYCVDSPLAWSPMYENAGDEWLDLVFDVELLVDRVRVYENHGAGATYNITFVNTLDEDLPALSYEVPWDLTGPGQPCSVLSLDIDDPINGDEFTNTPYDAVMMDLDTYSVSGWNEIDAVEITGLFDANSGPLPLSCDYL